MDAFKSLISPLTGGGGPLQDTLKLVVLGGTVETARRASASAWSGFVDSFFLTAHFSQEDYPYDWLMNWLSKQPAWGRSREFDITTRSVRNGQVSAGDIEDDEEGDEELLNGRKKRKVSFMPSVDTTHTIYYRGHWLRITRSKRFQDYGHYCDLKISVVARNNNIIKQLVLEAKRDYEKDSVHRVLIFMADSYGNWRFNGHRQKRPMSSIVLEPGVKEMLIDDCRDFLRSEDWYAERGIPFRRGYLLHGVPGSGKTSLIHSLAGELGLDIYVVSLSMKGMSDNILATLMGNIPSRCICLLEDLDAAFTRSVTRDSTSTGAPTTTTTTDSSSTKSEKTESDGSTLSLSGLLNSLDGVAAAEGRLLFATTNHIERLDPALSRPGRMDVWVNFTYASRFQAEGIFKCFFPCVTSTPSSASKEAEDGDVSTQNMPVPPRKSKTHNIPLLTEEELADLAKRFAAAIPEDELSVASLQGYLLRNKTRPRECIDEVADWVKSERELKEKLRKEKEEREAKEAKEKAEAEEKAKKALLEQAAKEKAEKEAEEAKEKTEKKEARAKAKKAARLEAAASPSSVSIADDSASPVTPTSEEDSQVSSSESSATSETDGADGDAEESVTSEEESEKGAASAASSKEKWVAVKGQPPVSLSVEV